MGLKLIGLLQDGYILEDIGGRLAKVTTKHRLLGCPPSLHSRLGMTPLVVINAMDVKFPESKSSFVFIIYFGRIIILRSDGTEFPPVRWTMRLVGNEKRLGVLQILKFSSLSSHSVITSFVMACIGRYPDSPDPVAMVANSLIDHFSNQPSGVIAVSARLDGSEVQPHLGFPFPSHENARVLSDKRGG